RGGRSYRCGGNEKLFGTRRINDRDQERGEQYDAQGRAIYAVLRPIRSPGSGKLMEGFQDRSRGKHEGS
ncbi:MAG: hypothetical protein VX633_02865, partial [Verrucomicrobiota bacterium]|nr:hypothetical protein [Verrucomicrobiota bacterium]